MLTNSFSNFERSLELYVQAVSNPEGGADIGRARAELQAALDRYIDRKIQQALDEAAQRATTRIRGVGRI